MSISPQFGSGVFPVGTHIYREPSLDQEQLLADLPLLKRLGFNIVKIQEIWSNDEPSEGTYDFSKIEPLIARAGELGLGIYLGLTMEQAPAWMWHKHPDCHLVYADGRPHNDPTQYCLPGDGKPGPCWDHPGARAAAEKFIEVLIQRLSRYENIWCWNSSQEVGWWPNNGGALGFCYCPHTLANFRVWLKEKYGTLAALNREWRTVYGDWEPIVPPRRESFFPAYIDWRYFMDDVVLTRHLEWKTAAIRRNDPEKRPVFAHVGPYQPGAAAEWRYAKVADFWGNSSYPAWYCFHPWDDDYAQRTDAHTSYLHEIWDGVMFRAELMRCAGGRDRAFWGAEFQGGPISTMLHMGRVPTAAEIRRWTFAGLASGMTGISYWNHRCEQLWGECNGFGLLDRLGETTERMEEVGRIACALQLHGDLFAQAQPPRAQVAILFNEDLWHFAQGSPGNIAEMMSYNLRGWYARLWRMGIPCDFLDAEQVASGELDHYPFAILPMPLALSADYFALLERWVHAGGTLLSEACPGRFGRNGICPPEQMVPGSEKVFGCRHAWVKIVREPGGKNLWTPEERSYGEFLEADELVDPQGNRLSPGFYIQALAPTTGKSILQSSNLQTTVGVCNLHGQGRSYLLGTFTGLTATAHAEPQSDAFFQKVFDDCRIQAQKLEGLLVRQRITDAGQKLWFLTNPARKPISAKIPSEKGLASLMPSTLSSLIDNVWEVKVDPAEIVILIECA